MIFRKKIIVIGGIVLIATVLHSENVHDLYFKAWAVFAKQQNKKLLGWLRCKARAQLEETTCPLKYSSQMPQFYAKLGLFITLLQGRKVRGCYGAFYHTSTDIHYVLHDYLQGALYRDQRQKPLEAWELKNTEIVLTVTTIPTAVNSIWTVDLQRSGVSIECDGKRPLVFVPAEVKSSSYLSRYITANCQVSAFHAITIRE